MSAVQRASGIDPQGQAPVGHTDVQRALLDPAVFIDEHCWIEGRGGTLERFRLWPQQREIVHAMDDHPRLLILKARQLGISWCSDGFILWLCVANSGQTVLIVSKGQQEAQEELRRIRVMIRSLPPELRPRTGGPHAKDSMSELEFPDNGSRIISISPTENAGSTFTASLVVIQELAKIPIAAPMLTSLNPIVGDGGRLHIISTALGYSGRFYEMWRDAQDRLPAGHVIGDPGERGEYVPCFLPWDVRPGRTQEWYAAMARTMPAKAIRQEYPATVSEAWQGSTDAYFGEEFDRATHAINGRRDPTNTFPVVAGIDPGISTGVGYLAEVYGRNCFVFREVWLQNCTVSEMGAAMREAMVAEGLDPADIVVHVDPFDVGRNLQTGKTDLDVLTEAGLLVARPPLGNVKSVPRVMPAQRGGLIKTLLKTQRLYVSTDCPHLLDALERIPWATTRASTGEMVTTDFYAKDGVHEHCVDAAGAFIVKVYPPVAAAAAETIVGTVYAEQAAIGGSEFG